MGVHDVDTASNAITAGSDALLMSMVLMHMQVPAKKKGAPTVVESKKEDVTGADDAPVSVAQPAAVSQAPAATGTASGSAGTDSAGGPAMRTRHATAGTEPVQTIT